METLTGKITDIEGNKFTLDGKTFFYVKKGLNMSGANIGVPVEFTYEIPEGKRYKVVNSWRRIDGSQMPVATASKPNGSGSSWKQQETGIEGVSEPVLRFISNVVGVAIEAKAITQPSQIREWVLGAVHGLKPQSSPIPNPVPSPAYAPRPSYPPPAPPADDRFNSLNDEIPF